MNPKTILTLVYDDRQGRKGGVYGETAQRIKKLFDDNYPQIKTVLRSYEGLINNCTGSDKTYLDNIDAGINGRWYKAYAISLELNKLNDGDFLIYNDCSPEIWRFVFDNENPIFCEPFETWSVSVIQNLTRLNNDILTCFVKWDCQAIPQNGLGLHIHKYFTMNRCMDRMGLRQYENSYQHASGMICIRKTPETVQFVEEWLYWNLNPECASLGVNGTEFWDAEHDLKIGHRHDQSISGLLLNKRNAKLVDILYNDMNPYNFLQYCRIGQGYNFIDSNSPVKRDDMDFTKVFIRRGSQVVNDKGIQLTVWRVDFVDGQERFIVGQYEESAWATTRDKLRLV